MPKLSKWKAGHVTCQAAVDDARAYYSDSMFNAEQQAYLRERQEAEAERRAERGREAIGTIWERKAAEREQHEREQLAEIERLREHLDAATAWIDHVLTISGERRVPSADVLADGAAIVLLASA